MHNLTMIILLNLYLYYFEDFIWNPSATMGHPVDEYNIKHWCIGMYIEIND